jgi:hypothetical protein
MCSLCLSFPQQSPQILKFLSSMLLGDGGFEPKRVAVDAICDVIEANPASKETGISCSSCQSAHVLLNQISGLIFFF